MDHLLNRRAGVPIWRDMRLKSLTTARTMLAGLLCAVALSTMTAVPAQAAAAHAGPAKVTVAKGQPIRIMPLGDSLTFGKGDRAENGYRGHLFTWLTLSGVHTDFVGSERNGTGADLAHEGHPGWRIAQLTPRVGGWMAKYRPDVVLLDIGTNDLLRPREVAGAPQRLNALLDRIVAANPDVRIVLAELLVVRGAQAPAFRAYNRALAAAAARHPGNVTLVDMSRIPAKNTTDGVHPNLTGYEQMAYQWYQALRQVLPTSRAWQPVASPFTAGR